MTVAFRLFYRNVYVTGLEAISKKGPVILIANHTSSLMDAAILGILLKRPVHFFTRGDIFMGSIANRLLSLLKMIPVHSHVRGQNHPGTNDESFLKAREILRNGGMILFFPEGNSHIERKLKPFRKGVFRLAFQSAMLDNTLKELQIVPVGINYSNPIAYREDIMVHAGPPLELENYRAEYLSNPAAALLRITKDSYESTILHVLHIADDSMSDVVVKCLEMTRNQSPEGEGWLEATRHKLDDEKRVSRQITSLPSDKKEMLSRRIHIYFDQLRNFNISDYVVICKKPFAWYKYSLLIIGLPLYCIGYLLNALPILISRRIADTRVHRPDFYSWIFLASSALLYFAWITILAAGFFGTVGWKYALIIVLSTLLAGGFAFFYTSIWKDCMLQRKIKSFKKTSPGDFSELQLQRNQILAML